MALSSAPPSPLPPHPLALRMLPNPVGLDPCAYKMPCPVLPMCMVFIWNAPLFPATNLMKAHLVSTSLERPPLTSVFWKVTVTTATEATTPSLGQALMLSLILKTVLASWVTLDKTLNFMRFFLTYKLGASISCLGR